MSREEQRMKCPSCGWFSLHDSEQGIECRTCGYKLTPGEADKFRLFKLLREESGKR